MTEQMEIVLPCFPKGYHLITHLIVNQLQKLPAKGILNIFIKHTSAGITINENFDSSVRLDFEAYFNKLVPENTNYFTHTSEGSDDMPAHLKASIIGQNLSIPITNNKLNMGTWQGIYLCEFRRNGGSRKLVLTIIS